MNTNRQNGISPAGNGKDYKLTTIQLLTFTPSKGTSKKHQVKKMPRRQRFRTAITLGVIPFQRFILQNARF